MSGEANDRAHALQQENPRHAFASVLIDGDCMPFTDELVRGGKEGGKRAASMLKQAVEDELRASGPAGAHHAQVIVRVYANMKDLAKTYQDTRILPQATYFKDFVRGFNMGDPMCDYVDAGDGKECSYVKIKSTFSHDYEDFQCKRILFGGSADNGYGRLLGPLAYRDDTRERITLVEGPPFARELADLKGKFRTVSFEKVFRSEKLVNSRYRAPGRW